jgi:glutamate decarboxylase
VGWALWRDAAALPEDLVFRVNYLGGDGFRRVQQTCRDVATSLAQRITSTGAFRLLTDGSELPVFAFTTAPDVPFSVFDVSAALREEGWLVPAYTFPKNREDIAALRIVVRNGFSHDVADLLLDDLHRILPRLQKQAGPVRGPEAASFAHGAGAPAGDDGRRPT